ncbi:MAG: RelA/SpoT family protein [Parcubacteria group bacterium]
MDVKEVAKENPSGLIGKAYAFAEKAHKGQRRASGEPYFEHPRKTADILLSWRLDDETIAAGLLHDVAEDSVEWFDELQNTFGKAITFLVEGVTKLGQIKYRGAEQQKENIKKLILASSKDVRVLFIKLADRYHNMQTLRFLPPEKQHRIALETYEIYAPLAYRLGMQKVSGELEDLAFPYINPEAYEWLHKNVKGKYEDREKYLARIKPAVIKALSDANIKPLKVDFRAKRYSSLYKKLLRYDMDIEKIYDLVAFRIIVESLADCYAALGVIHKLWPPIPGKIKDYIAVPKPNGYKSLHTVVIAVGEKPVEFQIRTFQMHEEAENGIAAHWAYEEKKGTKSYIERKASTARSADIEWIKRLRVWQEERDSSEDFIDSMKVDFFKDRIFALTPKGEVIDLPASSTPVDFAYRIHSDIGNQCIGAKVNGQIVPLRYELKSSDIVQIIIQKGKKPSSSWLEFVRTSEAKNHIRKGLGTKTGMAFTTDKKKTEFRVLAKDRIGLIKDVSGIISRSHVSIISINSLSEERENLCTIKVICDTDDLNKVQKLMLKLKSLKEIKEIEYRFV